MKLTSRTQETSSATVWRQMVLLALAFALLDLVTKVVAVAILGRPTGVPDGLLGLHLVYNDGLTGGFSVGSLTRPLNVLTTTLHIAALVWVAGRFAPLDALAPAALALMAGGGAGNLMSLLTEPHGVPDFLLFRVSNRAIVGNIADLGLCAGAVLISICVARIILAQKKLGAVPSCPEET